MRVGITNAVLSNTGDAAIFYAIKQVVESGLAGQPRPVDVVVFDSNAAVTSVLYPGWQVQQQVTQAAPAKSRWRFVANQLTRLSGLLLLSTFPGLLRRLVGSQTFRRTRTGRSLADLDSCDVVISSGGTYLVDHYDFTHRYVELRCAKALGKPIVLWTQSMGPFNTRRSKWLAKRIASTVDGVSCRDSRSADAWSARTGYRGPLLVAPDAAFALRQPRRADVRSSAERRRAALSVRAWNRGVKGEPLDAAPYEEMFQAAAEELHRLGWLACAISTCQGVESYAYDDSALAARVFDGLPVVVDNSFHSPEGLLEELAECQLVVTTRMHLAILALVSHVPVIAVAYEFKTVELFRSIGLEHAVIAIEDSSTEWMRHAVRRAVHEPDRFRLDDGQLGQLRDAAAEPLTLVTAVGPGGESEARLAGHPTSTLPRMPRRKPR